MIGKVRIRNIAIGVAVATPLALSVGWLYGAGAGHAAIVCWWVGWLTAVLLYGREDARHAGQAGKEAAR